MKIDLENSNLDSATVAGSPWHVAAGILFAGVLLSGIGGCAVGPNYHRPPALGTNAVPATFSEPGPTNIAIWHPAEPSAHVPRGQWWEVFNDPELNRLQVLAASNNQQIASALATLDQARALMGVARADYFPQVAANPSATRQRLSANQSPSATATSPIIFTVPPIRR